MTIKLKNVVKRYGSKLAVDNIDLTIENGEIFGLLGPNGAGKSTTIKMICGLLKPNYGEIIVDEQSISKSPLEVKRLIGLVPQDLAIYNNLTARENLEYFGSLYGLRGAMLKSRVNEALEFIGLSDRQKEIPAKFSGGMKRRLNIGCAIVHQPKIIIMDEPTVGIDPQSRNHILNSVKELNKRGSTIIYTSHYMEEVEAVCQRIGIIDHGKLISVGTLKELLKNASENEKVLIEALNIGHNPMNEIKDLNGVANAILNENTLEIYTKNAQEVLQDILFILSKSEVRVLNIGLKQPDLEGLFLSLTGRSLRDS